MRAVILAGGVRSGLELPGGLPRALWPFPSEALVTEVIRFVRQAGAATVAICANGKTKLIAAELSSPTRPWLDIHYSEDVMPRGPAGCLRDLQDWLAGDDVLAVQGTAFYECDLAAMHAQHRASGDAITIGVTRAGSSLELAGVFLLRPDVLDLVSPVGYQDIKEQLLPRVLQAGSKCNYYVLQGTVRLIHGIEHYLAALAEAIPRAAARAGVPPIAPGVWAHPTAHVDSSVRCHGPVWIDAHARLEAGAVVLGPALIGPACHIGPRAVLHRSALLKQTSVPPDLRVSGSIVTPQTRLAPRPRVARPQAVSGGRRLWQTLTTLIGSPVAP